MGTVYKAIDPRLDRVVALKVVRLDPSDLESKEFRQRFQAEARSAGRLSHPNIVIVYDFGELNDMAYIAMEFLRGESLRSMLDRQRFSTRRAVRYAGQIAEGLAAAHGEGVVHRDIKPANVVRLPNGLLKITDFGIARMPSSSLTQDGTLLGTPKYMSPEQVKSLRVDGRSDIFSLGVLLYEMLTATLPFGGATLSEVMNQIAHERPIHPLRWNPAIPESVVRILAKCLAKDPEARYQNVGDLARDLRIHKVMDVARDATIDEVFLPVNPTAPSTRSEAAIAAQAAAAATSEENTGQAFDKTMPMNAISDPAASATGGALAWLRPASPRTLGAIALAGVVVVAVGVAAMQRREPPPVAPPPVVVAPAPVVEAPLTTATVVAPPEVAKVSTDVVGDGAELPDPSAQAKVAPRRPKPAPQVVPVADATPARVEPPLNRVHAPQPVPASPASPVAERAAKRAAFDSDLKRQQECLRTNRCDGQ
jgi:serine/threonine-protein kinase